MFDSKKHIFEMSVVCDTPRITQINSCSSPIPHKQIEIEAFPQKNVPFDRALVCGAPPKFNLIQ